MTKTKEEILYKHFGHAENYQEYEIFQSMQEYADQFSNENTRGIHDKLQEKINENIAQYTEIEKLKEEIKILLQQRMGAMIGFKDIHEAINKNDINTAKIISNVAYAVLNGIIKQKKSIKKMKYTLPSGSVLDGTLEEITKLSKLLGETINDPTKIEGFDENKYHYSKDKDEWILIADMNTLYLMNVAKKKIRDYYNELKIPRNASIATFFALLEKWINDKELKKIVEELKNRERDEREF